MKKYKIPILLFIVFESIAILLWQVFNNSFYFFNFTYIGNVIAIGLILFIKKYKYARLFTQLGVGLYMLIYLGLMKQENMQIEGFWYYLFLGVFQATVIHYVIAKIFGPLLFGRGWCGYACWTAMVLDLFPYKTRKESTAKKSFLIPVSLFLSSILYTVLCFKFFPDNLEQVMFISFIIGNILYYLVGIILLFIFKDNRAFCKYVCPITVFLRPMSYYSKLRIQVNENTCISCNKCIKACPMSVNMLDSKRSRKNGTECILCMECKKVCPTDSI